MELSVLTRTLADRQETLAKEFDALLRERLQDLPEPRIRDDFPRSAEEWTAHAARLRRRLAEIYGLPPARCPLHPRIVAELPGDGYTLQKLIYDSEPGSSVTAHVYVPHGVRFPVPALLFANGHGGSKSAFYNQYGAQLYARYGAVCLTLDTIGDEERNEEGELGQRGHRRFGVVPRSNAIGRPVVGKMVLDVLRGLDYLCTRPDVDHTRLGLAGHSLGGVVTQYATAIDPRVRVSLPMAWVASYRELSGRNGCCHHLPGLSRHVDQAELLALAAPHCAVLVIIGETDNVTPPAGAEQSVADARRVYKLFGEPDQISLESVPQGGHRPYQLTRSALRWVARHLPLPKLTPEEADTLPEVSLGAWADANGVEIERLYGTEHHYRGCRAVCVSIAVRPPEELRCLNPAEWKDPRYSVNGWMDQVERRQAARWEPPSDRAAWEAERTDGRQAVADTLGLPLSPPPPPPAAVIRKTEAADFRVTELLLGETHFGALWLRPAGSDAPLCPVIYLHASGTWQGARENPLVGDWLRHGHAVFLPDLAPHNYNAQLMGSSSIAFNVQRVREAIDFIAAEPGVDASDLLCVGEIHDVALLAAALDERLTRIVIASRGWAGAESPSPAATVPKADGIVPLLNRRVTRALLFSLQAPRPLRLLTPELEAPETLAAARQVYDLYGASDHFQAG